MAVLVLRKAWRLGGIVFALIYYFTDKTMCIVILLPFLSFFIILEVLRLFIVRLNESLFRIFSFILKEKEKKALLATTWFLLSVFLCIILFSKEIAITATLFLIFGDIASAIVGTYFGRIRIRNHTLEGSLAFFVTCLIVGLITSFTQIRLPFWTIIVGALSAALIELVPLFDDNFTIALFSGIMMTIFSRFMSK